MSVYCLTIDMDSPVASSDPFIHLDSFLSFAAAVKEIGYDGIDDLDDDEPPEYFEDTMPLKRYWNDDEWVWACSSASIFELGDDEYGSIADNTEWSVTRWRKRFDNIDKHQIKETQIHTSRGEFKAYNAALPYNAAEELMFFFELKEESEPEDVKKLIEEHVPAIGKKRTQGFGYFSDISITEVGDTLDSAIYHNSRTLRSIPASFFNKAPIKTTIEYRSTKPPYWHDYNFCMSIAPFTDLPEDTLLEHE